MISKRSVFNLNSEIQCAFRQRVHTFSFFTLLAFPRFQAQALKLQTPNLLGNGQGQTLKLQAPNSIKIWIWDPESGILDLGWGFGVGIWNPELESDIRDEDLGSGIQIRDWNPGSGIWDQNPEAGIGFQDLKLGSGIRVAQY